ncbi:hypothetical protein C4K24_3766 [Pseudomonas chlororaphis subsp. aurantiaca]|nr:hypothetical protein C4K24_3766 [Pseudomonas chlororaphis subsp. aurantiaca]
MHNDSSLKVKRGRPFRKPSLADGGARVERSFGGTADRDQSSASCGAARRWITYIR